MIHLGGMRYCKHRQPLAQDDAMPQVDETAKTGETPWWKNSRGRILPLAATVAAPSTRMTSRNTAASPHILHALPDLDSQKWQLAPQSLAPFRFPAVACALAAAGDRCILSEVSRIFFAFDISDALH